MAWEKKDRKMEILNRLTIVTNKTQNNQRLESLKDIEIRNIKDITRKENGKCERIRR